MDKETTKKAVAPRVQVESDVGRSFIKELFGQFAWDSDYDYKTERERSLNFYTSELNVAKDPRC